MYTWNVIDKKKQALQKLPAKVAQIVSISLQLTLSIRSKNKISRWHFEMQHLAFKSSSQSITVAAVWRLACWVKLQKTTFWNSFNFRYDRLWDFYITREKSLNFLQTVETLIRRRVLRRLIWICTVCQVHFYGSPDYNGLKTTVLVHIAYQRYATIY